MKDKDPLSAARILMESQMRAEVELAHKFTIPWIKDRDPPGPGLYLVSISIEDDKRGVVYKSVRFDAWDGKWVTRGGYCRIDAWYYVPHWVE